MTLAERRAQKSDERKGGCVILIVTRGYRNVKSLQTPFKYGPLRTFEDVIHYGYKVVAHSSYYARILSRAEPGSGMRRTYETNFEQKKNITEAMDEVLNVPKTLILLSRSIVTNNPERKRRLDQMFPLSIDDSSYSSAGLALQKDSEFLQGGNQIDFKN